MRRTAAMILLLAALVLSGCIREAPLRVGSKLFAENRILAEMMAALAADRGLPVEKTIPYGNTFALQQAMRKDKLDLYPEYTGTGAIIMGAAVPPKPEETLEAVRRLFAPLGMSWLEPLGFDNSYVVIVTPSKAEEWNLRAISDLAERQEQLSITSDPEFMKRAVDGMASLVRRYGLSPEPKTITVENRNKLYRLLLAGETDVIVGNRTDPQIPQFNLEILKDDLEFFPVYEAAPLVRTDVLQRRRDFASALKDLAGRLDVETMRRLNAKVEQEGLDPEEAALGWLVQQGLLAERPSRPYQEPLAVAAPPMDETPPSTARALQAMRVVFQNRRIKLNTVALPEDSLRQGLAFVAVLGAEHFFELPPDRAPRLVPGIEAVAPLGFRVAHLLVPRDRVGAGKPFQGIKRLGVGPKNGSSARAAALLTQAYGAEPQLVTGKPEELAERTAEGKLDGLLIMAPQGDIGVTTMLTRLNLGLRAVGNWGAEDRQYRYPFFRLARLPADAYPGLDRSVETVGAQVTLAGPRSQRQVLGVGDPAAGLTGTREALPEGVKRRLVEALDAKEALDPALPGVNTALARRAPEPTQPLNPDPRASFLIAGFLLALAGFFVLLRRSGNTK